ncbi:CAP Gly-rich domain-containing protein [Strongyloides ratti]|uniref:ubiquitinyl hydrolase 1 n=1 Tax=Strongyloides ratti TaxID=34506 RepID=A0A090L698_STRRB|nr:CAP Gly-rich domain-containing protein [Strongyloides ratti]CEF65326.1 CAP Gly-rich domain-containing protein [Strongyloides ratti]
MNEEVILLHYMRSEDHNFKEMLPSYIDHGNCNISYENNTYNSTITYDKCYIIKENIDGFTYDSSTMEIQNYCMILGGTILQDVSPRLLIDILNKYHAYLRSYHNKSLGKIVIKKNLDNIDEYGVIDMENDKTIPLNNTEAEILKSVSNLNDRLKIFFNRERMDFLQDLIIGSECIVEIKNKLYPAKIESILQKNLNSGILFQVSIESSSMYKNAYGNSQFFATNESRQPIFLGPEKIYSNYGISNISPNIIRNGDRIQIRQRASSQSALRNPQYSNYDRYPNNMIAGSNSMQFSQIKYQPKILYGNYNNLGNSNDMITPSITYDGISQQYYNNGNNKSLQNGTSIIKKKEDHSFRKAIGKSINKGIDLIKSKSHTKIGSKIIPYISSNIISDYSRGSFDLTERIIFCDEEGGKHFGTVKYYGLLSSPSLDNFIGIQCDDDDIGFGNGELNGKRYFHCDDGKAAFVHSKTCWKMSDYEYQKKINDERKIIMNRGKEIINDIELKRKLKYDNNISNNKDDIIKTSSLICSGEPYGPPPSYNETFQNEQQQQQQIIISNSSSIKNFGNIDSGIEEKPSQPSKNYDSLIGRFKGIQGHNNSCYLDATLYSMFLQSTEFDKLILEKKKTYDDIKEFNEIQKILKNEIVYPLRKFHFVRADHVLKLRILLGKILNDEIGMTSNEKDPEEFMNALFEKVFKIKPLLRLRNINDGKIHDTFFCPLIADDSWTLQQRKLMNLQYLFDRSIFSSTIELAEIPNLLIIQLPRSGEIKIFEKIVPTMILDISNVVYTNTKICRLCKRYPATKKCPECFLTKECYLKDVFYCTRCFKEGHNDINSNTHVPCDVITKDILGCKKILLKLSAVLCIETSHYVSFVNCNVNSITPENDRWVFFDSMADREGLSEGYNVPTVKEVPNLSKWLTDEGFKKLHEILLQQPQSSSQPLQYDNDLLLKRLLADCYICIYQYTDELNDCERGLNKSSSRV